MTPTNTTKTTIVLDKNTWLTFRKACLDHRISAGRKVEELIQKQVNQWQGNAPLTLEGGRPEEIYRISHIISNPLNDQRISTEHEYSIEIISPDKETTHETPRPTR